MKAKTFLAIYLTTMTFVSAQIPKPTLSDNDVRLFVAIHSGNVNVVDSLLSAGADPNASYFNYMTALSYAAGLGSIEIVNKLLDKGADIDKTVGFSDPSALLSAIQANQNEVVRVLIERGASNTPETQPLQGLVFAVNDGGLGANNLVPAIIVSSESGNLGAVELLLENGADPNIVFRSNYKLELKGKTALAIAAQNGHQQVVEALINGGANADQPILNSINGQPAGTPLLIAAKQGHNEIVKTLIDANANLDVSDAFGSTALHWAAGLIRTEVVQVLLANNVEIESKNNMGSTPLMQAIQYKQILGMWDAFNNRMQANVVGKIFQFETFIRGAKTNWGRIDSLNDVGKVDYELIEQDMKQFQYGYSVAPKLDFQRINVEAQEIQGSLRAKNFFIIKQLLDKGADVLAQNNQGTVMEIAKISGSDEAVNVLLAQIKDGNELPFQSRLNAAILKGDLDRIRNLLNDDNISSEDAGTAFLWVTSIKDQNLLGELIGQNSIENFQNKNGLTALHFAVYNKRQDLVEYLIQQNANVNLKDVFGSSPLTIASREQYATIGTALKNAGAENQDNSLFDYAYTKSNLDTELLKLSDYEKHLGVSDFNLRYYHADLQVQTSDMLLGWLYQSFDSTARDYYLQAILSRGLLNLSGDNSIIDEFEGNMDIGKVSDVNYAISITYNTGSNPAVTLNTNGATSFRKIEDLDDDDDAAGSIAITMEGFRTGNNTVNMKWMQAFAGISGVGGWNNHDWIFNDPDPKTSTVSYSVRGKMVIPGCVARDNAFSACYPMLTIINHKDRVPIELYQNGNSSTLLANDTLIMDRSRGTIELVNNWSDRVSGHGSTMASSSKVSEWSIRYPFTNDISSLPFTSELEDRVRTYARLFALKLYLEKNGGDLNSHELFGLQTAINVLSELASEKYKDVARAELVGVVNFLENTDFTQFNDALISLLENELITVPEIRGALNSIINVDTTPKDLKTQLQSISNQLDQVGINEIRSNLQDYKDNYFKFLNNQILRYNDLLLEYSQFIPRDRLREQLTLDRITIFGDKLSDYSRETLAL